jgi:hypothetical protein
MAGITDELTDINPLFQEVYNENLYATDFVNHVYNCTKLKGLTAKCFQYKANVNYAAGEVGQNTVSKVLGAKCLGGDIQDHVTN